MSEKLYKRRWYQIGLRTIFVGIAIIALACCGFSRLWNNAHRQRIAAEAITDGGGWVFYYYQINPRGSTIPAAEPPGPAWLRNLVGEDLFGSVVQVGSMQSGKGRTELTLFRT